MMELVSNVADYVAYFFIHVLVTSELHYKNCVYWTYFNKFWSILFEHITINPLMADVQ